MDHKDVGGYFFFPLLSCFAFRGELRGRWRGNGVWFC